MPSIWNAVASRRRDEMTMSRSSLRIRCTQSMVVLALLAGSTVKTWPYLFLKWRAWFARGPSGRGRHWRRLQAGGRDGVEIRGVGQDALRHAPGYARLRRAGGYRSGEAVGAWLRRRRPDRRRAGSPRRERRRRGPVAAGLT